MVFWATCGVTFSSRDWRTNSFVSYALSAATVERLVDAAARLEQGDGVITLRTACHLRDEDVDEQNPYPKGQTSKLLFHSSWPDGEPQLLLV